MFQDHLWTFPDSSLELAIPLRSLVPFSREWYLEIIIWEFNVLICYKLVSAASSAQQTELGNMCLSGLLQPSTYIYMKNRCIYTQPTIIIQYQGYILVFPFYRVVTLFPNSEKPAFHYLLFFSFAQAQNTEKVVSELLTIPLQNTTYLLQLNVHLQ